MDKRFFVITPKKSYQCSTPSDGEFKAEPGELYLAKKVTALFAVQVGGKDFYWSVYDDKMKRHVNWVTPKFFQVVTGTGLEDLAELLYG